MLSLLLNGGLISSPTDHKYYQVRMCVKLQPYFVKIKFFFRNPEILSDNFQVFNNFQKYFERISPIFF